MSIRTYLNRLNSGNYLTLFREGLEYINFGILVNKNTRVFIKPNLTYPHFKPGVMTHPEAVEAAIQAIQDYTSHIFIGDADSGGYNRFSMDEVYQETGIKKITEKYEVELVNLSRSPRKQISFSYKGRELMLDLPSLLTEEIDLLVTMPVPKIHANTGVSLTFKNQWGCIPEPADRLRLHPFFKHVILEVNEAVKSKVAIIDGKYGLNFNGPMIGNPIELDWVMISNDIGAAALITCELMKINYWKIDHLRYANDKGRIPDRSEIILNLEVEDFLKENFILHRKITDIPGYLAFHNSFLADLAYFSPVSDLLHKLLYLIREPFYDYDKNSK